MGLQLLRCRFRWRKRHRSALVLIITGLAIAIPLLDLFITLVGAVGCTALALVVPPMIHLMVFWKSLSKVVIAKNFCIIVFGIIGAITGTYSSIYAIIDALYQDSHPVSTTLLPSSTVSSVYSY